MTDEDRPMDGGELDVPSGSPFSSRLDEALRASGLSARQVVARLADLGVQTSPALLSYWRRGSRRPGRGSSALVIAALESVLDVEPGSLAVGTALADGPTGLVELDITRVEVDEVGWRWTRSILLDCDERDALTVAVDVAPMLGLDAASIVVTSTTARAAETRADGQRVWIRLDRGAASSGVVAVELEHPTVAGPPPRQAVTVVGSGVRGALLVEVAPEPGAEVGVLQATTPGTPTQTHLAVTLPLR